MTCMRGLHRYLSRGIAIGMLIGLCSSSASSQAIQAIQNTDLRVATASPAMSATQRQAIGLALQEYRQALGVAGTGLTGTEADARTLLETLIRRGDEVLAAIPGDPQRDALTRYRTAEAAFFSSAGQRSVPAFSGLPRVSSVQGLPVPGTATLVPDIVFSVGPEFYSGATNSLTTIGISSNLLGAAGGAVFDALGSATLKDYFSKNVSVGTAFPTNGDNKKLSAQLGLGLGGINLRAITIWPVLNFEQTDREDGRVPTSIKEGAPDEKNWTSPIFSVAIVPFATKALEDRLRAGKLVPIPVLGVRLPYYYPGDVFTALGAVFTSKRADYVSSGKAQFIIAVSLPLLRIQPSQPKGGGSGTGTATEDQAPPSAR